MQECTKKSELSNGANCVVYLFSEKSKLSKNENVSNLFLILDQNHLTVSI